MVLMRKENCACEERPALSIVRFVSGERAGYPGVVGIRNARSSVGGLWRFEIFMKNMEKREPAFGAPSKGKGVGKGAPRAPQPPE